MHFAAAVPVRPVSPLMLADHLITLAQEAEQAGFPDAASHLVTLVYSVLEGPAVPAVT